MPFTFNEEPIVLRIAGGFGGSGVDAENAGTLVVARASAISAGNGLQFTDDEDQTVTLELMGSLEIINQPGTTLTATAENLFVQSFFEELEITEEGIRLIGDNPLQAPQTVVLVNTSVEVANASGGSINETITLTYTSGIRTESVISQTEITVADGETALVGADQILGSVSRPVFVQQGEGIRVQLRTQNTSGVTYTARTVTDVYSGRPGFLR